MVINMTHSELLSRFSAEIHRIVGRNRSCHPRIFGSVLHGNDTGRSDIDFLVDPLPGATLLDLGAIQIELEETLGVAVDVLTPGDLPVNFRDKVLRETMPI